MNTIGPALLTCIVMRLVVRHRLPQSWLREYGQSPIGHSLTEPYQHLAVDDTTAGNTSSQKACPSSCKHASFLHDARPFVLLSFQVTDTSYQYDMLYVKRKLLRLTEWWRGLVYIIIDALKERIKLRGKHPTDKEFPFVC